MKRALLFIFLISAVGLYASYNQWNRSGEVRCANVVSVQMDNDPGSDNSNIGNDDISKNINSNILQFQQPGSDIESGNPPSHYAPCWADDILIWDDWNLGANPIAFDYDADGYLYVAAITRTTCRDDSLIFLKSTDNGYTWNQFWLLHSSQEIEMWDFDMRVGHVGSDPHVYVVLFDSNYTDGQREMWFFDYNQVTAITSVDFFDPDTYYQFESPFHVSMDITDEATPKIWITYNQYYSSSANWNSVYSTDGGSTWNTIAHATGNGCSFCDVSMGPDDWVYVVNVYTQDNYRVRMNQRQIGGSNTYYNVSPTGTGYRIYPCVASERHVAYGSNVIHVLYQDDNGPDGRIMNSFSSNGGSTWNIDQYWSPVGDIPALSPNVRCGWNCDQFIGSAVVQSESLATAWASNQYWGSATYVSDHWVEYHIIPQGVVGSSTGRQIVYAQDGTDNLWYDRYDMSNSVEEISQGFSQTLNITSNGFRVDIQFSLDQTQPVNISLFDVTGRNIRDLCNQTLSAGNHSLSYDLSGLNGSYIVCFQAEKVINSEKIILF